VAYFFFDSATRVPVGPFASKGNVGIRKFERIQKQPNDKDGFHPTQKPVWADKTTAGQSGTFGYENGNLGYIWSVNVAEICHIKKTVRK